MAAAPARPPFDFLLSAFKKNGPTSPQTVPEIVFHTRLRNDALGGPNPFEWKDVSTAEFAEPDFRDDPPGVGVEVSNAETMLAYLKAR